MKKKDQGFTLVELLIVIVILGILATVTVFAVRGITDQGQNNACEVERRTLDTAIESYYAQNQADPATIDDLTLGPITDATTDPVTRATDQALLQGPPSDFTLVGGEFVAVTAAAGGSCEGF